MTGLPSGVTGAFNPASVTAGGSSQLTFSAAANAATGTFAVNVVGTATSTSHSTPFTLTVTAATTVPGHRR